MKQEGYLKFRIESRSRIFSPYEKKCQYLSTRITALLPPPVKTTQILHGPFIITVLHILIYFKRRKRIRVEHEFKYVKCEFSFVGAFNELFAEYIECSQIHEYNFLERLYLSISNDFGNHRRSVPSACLV